MRIKGWFAIAPEKNGPLRWGTMRLPGKNRRAQFVINGFSDDRMSLKNRSCGQITGSLRDEALGRQSFL
jgi:hypothetical protein